jgi:hypothetical protein
MSTEHSFTLSEWATIKDKMMRRRFGGLPSYQEELEGSIFGESGALPRDVVDTILGFLGGPQFLSLRGVSRNWNRFLEYV